MQVLLMLTADLDGEEDKDKLAVEAMLRALDVKQTVNVAVRSPKQEVHLVIMRLLSMSKILSFFHCLFFKKITRRSYVTKQSCNEFKFRLANYGRLASQQ